MSGQAKGAAWTSGILAAVALSVGIIYCGPTFWTRRALPSGQISLVAEIESWGPIWPAVFLSAALALIWAVCTRRQVALAHSWAAGVWTFYATAMILSAAYSEPPGPILSAVIAYGAVALHLSMIRVWADLGVK